MRELSMMEVKLVGGADGEADVDTCDALGTASGALAEFLLLQRSGLSGLTFFNAQLVESAVSSTVDGVCTASADWVSDAISSLEQNFQDASEYLELFNYYRQWGSPI